MATTRKQMQSNCVINCHHMGCSCQKFTIPTSKWAKNKSKCQTCDHSEKEHTNLIVHATNIQPEETVPITKNVLAATKTIALATAEKTFIQKQVNEMDDKFKYLVYGYSKYCASIPCVPDIIIFIILSYYYVFDIEEFDIHLCADNITISNFNKNIRCIRNNGFYSTCYGVKIIPSSVYKTYIWKFENVGGNTRDLKIGICNITYTETLVHRKFTLDAKHEFYAFQPFVGKVQVWNQRPKFGFPKSVRKRDIIVMQLKITKYIAVLSFKVNKSKEYRACNVVQREHLYYRMAVTLSTLDSCIELIDFKMEK
eukprot:227290_1